MAFLDENLTSDSKMGENTDQIITVADSSSPDDHLKYVDLVAYIKGRWERAKDKRRWDEERWLSAYNNYRGIYSPEVQFLDTEKSRAFYKITKTKVLAARAQLEDILFAANKFPIGIEPSPVVKGVEESVYFDPKEPERDGGGPTGGKGPAGGGGGLPSTVARPELASALGPLKKMLEPVMSKLKIGSGKTPTSQTFEPAKEAAKSMEKLIHDQLLESQADKHIRSFLFEMCLFGHGVFKGPFLVEKEYSKWGEDGTYAPEFQKTADVSFVSVWDAYPDPDARNIQECDYFIQRHRLSRTQLRQLKKRPGFRADAIERAVEAGPQYTKQYWENTLQDYETHSDIERWEGFEFWGVVDKEIAEKAGLILPPQIRSKDQVEVTAWICNNELLRLVINPFTPMRIPYNAAPYEINPYSFFGVGVAENMEDTQLLMNGALRQMVDNMVLSSNVVAEVNDDALLPGQDMRLYPGKIFRRTNAQAGQAINFLNVPNITQNIILAFDKFRQLSDESTGMPSYSHGISGVMGVGRTASGMSMLMGAAKENTKAVVRNIDDYLLVPLGKAMFSFNMQFNFDPKYIGDLEVVARGTESLMRNEVRSQKLMQFLQVSGNPMDAPYIKRDYIWRELAQSLDLEPDKTVNDPREAAIQAEIMKELAQRQGIPPQDAAQQGGNPAGMGAPSDPTGTGGGNIQPGAAPTPGAQGFTGAGGGMNSPPPQQGQPQ